MAARHTAMSAKQFNSALRKLELTPYASARVLGIGLRSAQRYAAGEQPIPLVVSRLIEMVIKHGIPDAWRSAN
jgi:hypothetical protein